jgi:hypothetical protein
MSAGVESCALGDLAPGETLTVTATYWVPWGYTGTDPLVNNATVASAVHDPQTADNIASAGTDVIYTDPVIGLAKAADSVTYDHATTSFGVTLIFTEASLGTQSISQVQVTDNLDATFGRVSYTVTALSSSFFTVNPAFDGSSDLDLLDGYSEMMPAEGVILADPAPDGLIFSSADAPCESGFPCDLGVIAAGSEVVVSVTYDLPED